MSPITQDDLRNRIPAYLELFDSCPFCGKNKMAFSFRKINYTRPAEFRVRFRCKSCNFGTGWSVDPDKLVRIWNSAKR